MELQYLIWMLHRRRLSLISEQWPTSALYDEGSAIKTLMYASAACIIYYSRTGTESVVLMQLQPSQCFLNQDHNIQILIALKRVKLTLFDKEEAEKLCLVRPLSVKMKMLPILLKSYAV